MATKKETIPLKEAASRMGRQVDELSARMRYCAMKGLYFPLGFAIPPANDSGQWMYVIPRQRFDRYMAGEDFVLAKETGAS